MRENCRPKKRQPDTTRIASQVVRPVMGSVRSRFFTRLHAKTPIRPPKIPPNSFVQRILPVTPTRSTGCAQIPAIFMKTRNFGGRGEGYPRGVTRPVLAPRQSPVPTPAAEWARRPMAHKSVAPWLPPTANTFSSRGQRHDCELRPAAHPLRNPVRALARAQSAANIERHLLLADSIQYCRFDLLRFSIECQVRQHHRAGENRAHGIGEILARDRRGRAVYRLEHRGASGMDIAAGRHTESSLQRGGQVGNDV